MRLTRFLITLALLCGLGGSLIWISSRQQKRERLGAQKALAETVSRDLHRWVDQQARVIAELAEHFGAWEKLPPLALQRRISATARRHLSLRQILVADPAGRLLAGYDSNRRLGHEVLRAGQLDPVLARRDALRSAGRFHVVSSSRGGRLLRLELAAPLRSPDGHLRGYVGASLNLDVLRELVDHQSAAGLRLDVEDLRGNQLPSCAAPASSGRWATGRLLRVRAAMGASPRRWPMLLAGGLTIGIFLGLFGLWRILDSRRKMMD